MDHLDLPPLLDFGASDASGVENAGEALQFGVAFGGGAHAGVAQFGGASVGEQLDLLPPLDELQDDHEARQSAFPTSQPRAANARSAKAVKRAIAKATTSAAMASSLREDLELASSVLLDVGRVLGASVGLSRVPPRSRFTFVRWRSQRSFHRSSSSTSGCSGSG